MDYEWDPAKAGANLGKHGVDFAVAVGVDPLGRTLVVVYTHRGERIRIISARPANPAERRAYEEGDR